MSAITAQNEFVLDIKPGKHHDYIQKLAGVASGGAKGGFKAVGGGITLNPL